MPVCGQDRMSMRCPVCFARGIDVVLFRDEAGYYCVKCSFVGVAEEIESAYAAIRRRFRLIGVRLPSPQAAGRRQAVRQERA